MNAMNLDLSVVLVMILVWSLYLILKKSFFDPINQILTERDAEINGAQQEARGKLAEFEQKSRAYQDSLKLARLESYRQQESFRAEALRELATSFAQTQQWERAQAVIATIEHSSLRARALTAVGAEIAETGEDESLLHLLQRSWRLADNRDYALDLFPLVTGFIPRNPELGVALHEAFAWVDDFLRGQG